MSNQPAEPRQLTLEALRGGIWKSIEHDLDADRRDCYLSKHSDESDTERQLALLSAHMRSQVLQRGEDHS
jgi:hypothetical protein